MGVYRCKQGWIGITIVTPAQWKSFCDVMGMPELGRDPNHVMGGERLARADALEARFIPRFLDRTAEEWFALGLELRLPFAARNSARRRITPTSRKSAASAGR